MLFKRFYDDQLAQASYMVACETAGVALIVDPNRDAAFYIREAARERLRIAYVTETHIHADFVSGSRELAQAASAQLLLSDEGGDDWRYAIAKEGGATLLRDGSEITMGNVRVRAMHTPGHTPEHLAFLVTDRKVSEEPLGMLSGDFIFVGEVGRPDLLEKAANRAGTMESAARMLYQSLQRLRPLPDFLQIWPGHGAGSACGKSLGAMPQSTLGYERISNWALQVADEATFVRAVLEDQPSPPRYFALMKEMNKNGPPIFGKIQPAVPLSNAELAQLQKNGAILVDIRAATSFSQAHMKGAINIPLNKSFTKWAGSVLQNDRDLCIFAGAKHSDSASDALRHLAMVGLDRVRGFVTDAVLAELARSGISVEKAEPITAAAAAALLGSAAVNVLDVRDPHELYDGFLEGAQNIPLSVLAGRVDELPADKPLLVYCQTGNRSGIAASVLKAAGLNNPINLAGGIVGWQKDGFAVSDGREKSVSLGSRAP